MSSPPWNRYPEDTVCLLLSFGMSVGSGRAEPTHAKSYAAWIRPRSGCNFMILRSL